MFSMQLRIMRKLLYILMLFALACSCQREELESETQGNGISTGEATISFSAVMPTEQVSTKSMGGELSTGIDNLYLVVFDENGMLVETRKAQLGDQVSHNGHPSEQKYSVTLTLTEKTRIIHFIANCPANQVVYGHEASVIGNMYVENGKVAYWARAIMDELVIQTDTNGNPVKDSHGNPILTEMNKFKCVPMLRNYAQFTVTNDDDQFQPEGFLIYNVTHRGTVAPYNSYSEEVGFQSFIKEGNSRYTYPELYNLPYYGHSLTTTPLITTIPNSFVTSTCDVDVYRWTNGVAETETVTGYGPVNLYERKISVKQGNEADWRESPSHVIIKGKFDSDKDGSFADETSTFYKVDLTRKIDGVPQYYNILRNFHYNFTVHSVHTNGYGSLEEAIAGAPGNNLSGSVATSKFDNISDQEGRLWVSYTAKTMVEGGNGITLDFYYRYVPNLDNINVTANDTLKTGVTRGVKFERIIGGKVIDATQANKTDNIVISTSDETTGIWAGYRKVTFNIKEPKALTEEQTFTIKAIDETNENAEILSRDIHLILKNPYDMRVNIPAETKKVATNIGESVEVDILIPDDLTENLFPLDLNIEAEMRSLSPDLNKNTLPVVSGSSVIPSKNGVASFYYVKTIDSYEIYKDLEERTIEGNTYKVIKTYWITNRTDNESKVYVQNEYFYTRWDNFVNAKSLNGEFRKGSLGVSNNETVDYTFNVASIDNNPVFTITLGRLIPTTTGNGLAATDVAGVYTYTPQNAGVQTIHLKATEAAEGECSITITSDDSFGYADESDTIYQTASITIAAGKLITNIARKDGFADGGTISIYTNSNYTGTSVGYSYTRTTNGAYSNGRATNTKEISLTGVKDNDTLYIRYVNGTRTYTGSFVLSDARDNNGATITLTQQ